MFAVEVRELSKSFPAEATPRPGLFSWLRPRAPAAWIPALEEVDFTVEFGEIVGIVGANGSGKTTLLRILAALEVPDTGEASVCGFDVERDDAEVRRNVGIVLSEDRGFQRHATLRRNLELAGGECGRHVGKPDIYYALDAAGLIQRADDPYSTLSTGLKRRLSLARALLGDPRVLLLDEPTRSVDSESAERMTDLIRHAAHSRGAAILLVSQNREEIRDLCDRTLLLDRGRLLHVTTALRPALQV